MPRRTSIHVLLLAFLVAACSGDGLEGTDFIAPLDNIRLGMEKKDVTRHLPTTYGLYQETALFVSLVEIRESPFRAAGLSGLYLFFRRDGERIVLNAAMLEFDKSETGRITGEADRRYGARRGRFWKPSPGATVELDTAAADRTKLIYDTARKK